MNLLLAQKFIIEFAKFSSCSHFDKQVLYILYQFAQLKFHH